MTIDPWPGFDVDAANGEVKDMVGFTVLTFWTNERVAMVAMVAIGRKTERRPKNLYHQETEVHAESSK
jgi:hypothetical protein